MTKIRLEIDNITIHRPKKRWELYFVVVTDHPTEEDKMIVTTLPENPIKLSPFNANNYYFDDQKEGSEGLFILDREMPANRELNVHIYVRHSRHGIRNLGSLLKNVEAGLVGDTFGIVTDIVGNTAAPWLIISKKASKVLGDVLADIKDRDLGFINAYEKFGKEFEGQTEIDHEKIGAHCTVVYSWSVEE